jgi:hypothetical protein
LGLGLYFLSPLGIESKIRPRRAPLPCQYCMISTKNPMLLAKYTVIYVLELFAKYSVALNSTTLLWIKYPLLLVLFYNKYKYFELSTLHLNPYRHSSPFRFPQFPHKTWEIHFYFYQINTIKLSHSNSKFRSLENVLISFDLRKEMFFTTTITLQIFPNTDLDHIFLYLRKHLVMLNESIASILWYTTNFHISILTELEFAFGFGIFKETHILMDGINH